MDLTNASVFYLNFPYAIALVLRFDSFTAGSKTQIFCRVDDSFQYQHQKGNWVETE